MTTLHFHLIPSANKTQEEDEIMELQERMSKECIHKAEILDMPVCTVSRETGIPIFTASSRKDFIATQFVRQVTYKTIHDFHAYPQMDTFGVDGVLRDPRHGALVQRKFSSVFQISTTTNA